MFCTETKIGRKRSDALIKVLDTSLSATIEE